VGVMFGLPSATAQQTLRVSTLDYIQCSDLRPATLHRYPACMEGADGGDMGSVSGTLERHPI